MRFYIDSSDINQIKKWKFMVDGCTTNPKILAKDGAKDIISTIEKIANENLFVSVELLGESFNEMYVEAKTYASISPNVVIKVPVLGYDSLKLINVLEKDKIKTNATGCCSISQAVSAALAGASYVSLFWGRIGDEGGFPYDVVVETKKIFENINNTSPNLKPELIVGSLRSIEDVTRAMLAKADILTITPDLLEKLVKNAKTIETIKEFNEAWKERK